MKWRLVFINVTIHMGEEKEKGTTISSMTIEKGWERIGETSLAALVKNRD